MPRFTVTLTAAFFAVSSVTAADVELPVMKEPSEVIVFSKKSWCTVIGYTKSEDDEQIFEDTYKELQEGCSFATASSESMLAKYELSKKDLPAAVLLRNFNDSGKDIKNRREVVIGSVKKKSIASWDKESLVEFITKQGVAPLISPGGGPDDKARWALAMKSKLPKLVWYYESTKQYKDVVEAFKVEDDAEPEFFPQVLIIMLQYTGDDEIKKQMRQMGQIPDKTDMKKMPIVAGGGKVIASGLKTSKAIQKELRKILQLSGPKKKEEKGGPESLGAARKEWVTAKKKKEDAVAVEEFLVARDEFEKQKAAFKAMEALAEKPEHVLLAQKSKVELEAELEKESDAEKKKVIEDLIKDEL